MRWVKFILSHVPFTVKTTLKSIDFWRSYRQKYVGSFFMAHGVIPLTYDFRLWSLSLILLCPCCIITSDLIKICSYCFCCPHSLVVVELVSDSINVTTEFLLLITRYVHCFVTMPQLLWYGAILLGGVFIDLLWICCSVAANHGRELTWRHIWCVVDII